MQCLATWKAIILTVTVWLIYRDNNLARCFLKKKVLTKVTLVIPNDSLISAIRRKLGNVVIRTECWNYMFIYMGRKESKAENEKVNDHKLRRCFDFHQFTFWYSNQPSSGVSEISNSIWLFPLIIVVPYLVETTVPSSLQWI